MQTPRGLCTTSTRTCKSLPTLRIQRAQYGALRSVLKETIMNYVATTEQLLLLRALVSRLSAGSDRERNIADTLRDLLNQIQEQPVGEGAE